MFATYHCSFPNSSGEEGHGIPTEQQHCSGDERKERREYMVKNKARQKLRCIKYYGSYTGCILKSMYLKHVIKYNWILLY